MKELLWTPLIIPLLLIWYFVAVRATSFTTSVVATGTNFSVGTIVATPSSQFTPGGRWNITIPFNLTGNTSDVFLAQQTSIYVTATGEKAYQTPGWACGFTATNYFAMGLRAGTGQCNFSFSEPYGTQVRCKNGTYTLTLLGQVPRSAKPDNYSGLTTMGYMVEPSIGCGKLYNIYSYLTVKYDFEVAAGDEWMPDSAIDNK
jgi:hypothetical protein